MNAQGKLLIKSIATLLSCYMLICNIVFEKISCITLGGGWYSFSWEYNIFVETALLKTFLCH